MSATFRFPGQMFPFQQGITGQFCIFSTKECLLGYEAAHRGPVGHPSTLVSRLISPSQEPMRRRGGALSCPFHGERNRDPERSGICPVVTESYSQRSEKKRLITSVLLTLLWTFHLAGANKFKEGIILTRHPSVCLFTCLLRSLNCKFC